MRRYLISAAAAFGLLVSADQATSMAFTLDINSLNSTSSNTPATGASGSILFDFSDITGGVQLDLTVTNTTGSITNPLDSGATDSRLTQFVFDSIPQLTLDEPNSSLTGKLDELETNVSFTPFSNSVGNFSIGVCHRDNCQDGQPNTALEVGESSMAELLFTTTSTADVIASSLLAAFNNGDANAALRFQSVNGTGASSDKLLFGGDVSTVPLPATLPLLLGALGVLGFGMSRKRSA